MRMRRYFSCFSWFPFFPVSGSVAPRTYYTNCSFPKSDCQQKAGNESNHFNWSFHSFGSFLVLIFTNLFAPREIWHFEIFPKLKFGPINSSHDKHEIHYHKWHFVVGQIQMPPSLNDFQSVMGELKCSCGIIWNQDEVEPTRVSSSVQTQLLGFPEELFFHIYT